MTSEFHQMCNRMIETCEHEAYHAGFAAARNAAAASVHEMLHSKYTQDRNPLCVLEELAKRIEALKPEALS